jgi:hypothetical protein
MALFIINTAEVREQICVSDRLCCPGVLATHTDTIREIIYFIMLLSVSVSTTHHMAQSETEYKVSGQPVRIGNEAVMACLSTIVSH